MSGYSVEQYAGMLADPYRREAFCRSMQSAIGPDTVVLDLGAGTGILSLLACRYGARRVYAIEPNPAIRLLPDCARDNGYGDRIISYCEDSQQVDLPEQVDLIIADLRGTLPVLGGAWSALVDACSRFLKPGGKVLPARDQVYLAPVSEPLELERQAALWRADDLGVDLRRMADFRRGVVRRSSARAGDLIATEQRWARIDYLPEPHLDSVAELQFVAERDAQLDGFLIWFDLDFDDDVRLSNHPNLPNLVYGRSIFSLSRSVAVSAGDQIVLRLKLITGQANTWVWSGCIRSATGLERSRFKDSTLKASMLTLAASNGPS